MLNWQLLFAVVVADPGKKAIHPYWCQTKVRNQKLRVEAKPETLRRGPPSPPRFNVEMKGHLRPDIFKTKLRNSFSTFAHNVDSGGGPGGFVESVGVSYSQQKRANSMDIPVAKFCPSTVWAALFLYCLATSVPWFSRPQHKSDCIQFPPKSRSDS